MDALRTAHGDLPLPAFLPDATRGVVRSVDAEDLRAVGVPALMVNALHLSQRPGTSAIRRLGGVHRFMDWDRPVFSDSGGFQVYSLGVASPELVRVSRRGFAWRRKKGGRRRLLTPEKCIQRQFDLGADVMFCLDLCTHPDQPDALQREAVARTVDWARRSRAEFDRRLERWPDGRLRPLLFAVVQGGASLELRRECSARLVEIGFDGYGFGGWPVDAEGRLVEMVEVVAGLLPPDAPKHALGIATPGNVARAWRAGYGVFDCALPTRDARHGRLMIREDGRDRYLYVRDRERLLEDRPVEEGCDCATCRRFSRAYLHHLFRVGDAAAPRLAPIHNLRFYVRLMERLRGS
jgi:queuine tRNA-ribosyltransferase